MKIDELSLANAHRLYEGDDIEKFEIGITKALSRYTSIFSEALRFCRKIREVNISKWNLRLASGLYLSLTG